MNTKRAAMDIISTVKDAGADVINIIFGNGADIDSLWPQLLAQMKATPKTNRRLAQPAFDYRHKGTLMTMFSPKCGSLVHEASPQQLPESSQCKVPCICLTFRGHAGKMTIINTQWKGLPRHLRSGLIPEYAQIHSDAEPSHRIIGGIMN